jgi:hypothetical protein
MEEPLRVSRLESALRAIALELDHERRPWALVGGLAVSARAEPRFTRDVDLAVATADDREAEALVRRLMISGYRVLATLEQEAAGRLATVRLAAPGQDASAVVVDLLFASSGVEAELTRDAEVLEVLPGLRVPVARCGHLLALKILSVSPGRPQDLIDILSLLREATPADVEQARETAALIVTRGYDRGRDVVGELEKHLRSRG